MPRFAILIHDHPVLHWDLLLEHGAACRTWRLLTDPGESVREIPAEELPDHRLLYLDYEGPVSGNRGTVSRWDAGIYSWRIDETDVVEVMLSGHRWQGVFRMEQIEQGTWKGFRVSPLAIDGP
jgi:hypothetical protein